MGAALCHPAAVEDDDLVHLVQPVHLVRDEQRRAAAAGGLRGRGQQVRGQRPPVVRVQVRGGLVQDQQRGVGQQRPGQRDPLPLAA